MSRLDVLKRHLRRALHRGPDLARRPSRPVLWRRIGLALAALAISAAVLAVWWVDSRRLLDAGGTVTFVHDVHVDLLPDRPVVVGRDDLGQRRGPDAADLAHIQFALDPAGRVTVANVSRERNLALVRADGTEELTGRRVLAAGDRFYIRSTAVAIDEVAADAVALTVIDGGARHFRIGASAGVTSAEDGSPLPECRPRSRLDRTKAAIAEWSARFVPAFSRPIRVAWIGGRLACLVDGVPSIPAPTLPWRSLAVYADHGRFVLAMGVSSGADTLSVRVVPRGAPPGGLTDAPVDLEEKGRSPVVGLIAGRTTYAVDLDRASADHRAGVTLTAKGKMQLFTAEKGFCPAPEGGVCAADQAPSGFEGAAEGVTRRFHAPVRLLDLDDGSAGVLGLLGGAEWGLRLVLVLLPVGLRMLLAGAPLRPRGLRDRLVALWPFLVVAATALVVLAPEVLWFGAGRTTTPAETIPISILAFVLPTLVFVADPRLRPAPAVLWVAVLALLAFGALTLTSLALDGPSTHWTGYLVRHLLLFLGPFAVQATFAASLRPREIRRLLGLLVFGDGRLGRWARVVPLIVVTAVFLLWLVFGDETGVQGFQPVEFGKITVVIAGALFFAGLDRVSDPSNRRLYRGWLLGSVAAILALAFVLILVPAFKSDYSPLLIVLAVATLLAVLYLLPWGADYVRRSVSRRLTLDDRPTVFRPKRDGGRPGRGILVATFGGLVLAAALIVAFKPLSATALIADSSWPEGRDDLFAALEAAADGWRRVPLERLTTWMDVDFHPADGSAARMRYRDLGLQLLRSREAVAASACDTARLDLGPVASALVAGANSLEVPACLLPDPSTPPPTADGLVRIPVIQNDFIATYVTGRFGVAASMTLLLLQGVFLAAAGWLAATLPGRREDGESERVIGKFLSVLTVGLASLFLLHWSIAWSNMLGLLPVMGQPMTLTAAATSHHLFMAGPALLLLVAVARHAGDRRLGFSLGPPRLRRA